MIDCCRFAAEALHMNGLSKRPQSSCVVLLWGCLRDVHITGLLSEDMPCLFLDNGEDADCPAGAKRDTAGYAQHDCQRCAPAEAR